MVRYDSTTLPDLPFLSYKVDQLERLVDDWDHSSFITIDGVGIPLCYWKKIYSWIRPKVWRHIKDQWMKYKFIVAAFKYYADMEGLLQVVTFQASDSQVAAQFHKRLTITGISDALTKLRNLRDKRNIASAKAEYSSETFAELFNYKKGGKRIVMKKEKDIARCYCRIKGMKVYWDNDLDLLESGDEMHTRCD